MTSLALLRLLTETAHAVRLDAAGQWGPNGPNAAVMVMWTQICTVLPFCNVGATAPMFFAAKIARFLLSAITATAICFIIYSGIRVIMGQGEEEGLTEAKKTIGYALGGIALAIMAQAIIYYFEMSVLREALQ